MIQCNAYPNYISCLFKSPVTKVTTWPVSLQCLFLTEVRKAWYLVGKTHLGLKKKESVNTFSLKSIKKLIGLGNKNFVIN